MSVHREHWRITADQSWAWVWWTWNHLWVGLS